MDKELINLLLSNKSLIFPLSNIITTFIEYKGKETDKELINQLTEILFNNYLDNIKYQSISNFYFRTINSNFERFIQE